MKLSRLIAICGLAALSLATWVYAFVHVEEPNRHGAALLRAAPPAPTLTYEEWARREFRRRHPGQKPLNWKIAAKAEEFREDKPMGRFVLDRNDCSDFADAVIDDALGAQARFRRASDEHLLSREKIWEVFYWDRHTPLQPGDEIVVRHSPWYPPSADAPWHLAIVGTDGMAYDWTKLRSWRDSNYGRHSVEWFTQNASEPKEVVVVRLAAAYRYRIKPLPLSGAG